ncbi:MAG: hypothetical protein HC836_43020 [Richelia sp. RM2_1_2]|nr:hypothetical protein [Richelia sp. RM2_1_2]
MKFAKLVEYDQDPRTTVYPESIVQSRLDKAKMPIGQVSSLTQTFLVYYYEESNQGFYIISNREKTELYGHIIIEHIAGDVWQVKDAYVKIQGEGLGTNLYFFIIRVGNKNKGVSLKKLIHDTQLSPIAERIWKVSLVKKGITRKIYDKKLGKVYSEADIGQLTSDGVAILNPENDKTDYENDSLSRNMRFFWLVESMYAQQSNLLLREEFLEKGLTHELSEEILKLKGVSLAAFTSTRSFSAAGEF